jgi:hypothetical protein
MNVWLLTWEAYGAYGHLSKRIVAVLSSRRSDRSIADMVELLYERATFNVSSMTHFANHRRRTIYQAHYPILLNGIPHGGRVCCGSNPVLYARQVTEFQVRLDKAQGRELVSWREPSTFRWIDGRQLTTEGEVVMIERDAGPVANDFAE